MCLLVCVCVCVCVCVLCVCVCVCVCVCFVHVCVCVEGGVRGGCCCLLGAIEGETVTDTTDSGKYRNATYIVVVTLVFNRSLF